jgi:hypothetical protein
MKYFRISIFLITFLCVYNFKALANSVSEKGDERPSACSITEFVIGQSWCDDDYRAYFFDITATEFGLNGFNITFSNSSVIYNYALNDPWNFGLHASCDEEVIATIADNDNPNCNMSINLGRVCCVCDFFGMQALQTSCSNSFFNASLSLELSGSCLPTDAQITVNGVSTPYTYSNWMYHLENLQSFEPEIEYEICFTIANFGNFCDKVVVPNTCLPNINTFDVFKNTASCANDSIDLNFNFSGESFGLNGFQILSNVAPDKSYKLGDPYVYKIPANCFENVELTIIDNNANFVMKTTNIGKVCCPCTLDYRYTFTQCKDQSFDIRLSKFEPSKNCKINKIAFLINRDTIPLLYNDTLYYVKDFKSQDSLFHFNLTLSLEDTTIRYLDTLVNPCPFIPCAVSDLTITKDENSCTGSDILLNFSFKGAEFGKNGYHLIANNGFTKLYQLNDPTVLKIPADCNLDYEFFIIDADHTSCAAQKNINTLCCPCKADIAIINDGCINGSAVSNLIINTLEGSCTLYDWTLNVNETPVILTKTPSGYTTDLIGIKDSLLRFEWCNLVPSLPECFNYTVENPCYTTLVSTNNLEHPSFLKVVSGNGESISVRNTSDINLDFEIYSINGLSMTKIQTIAKNQEINIPTHEWSVGLYIIKTKYLDHISSTKFLVLR